jgi:inorganic pyrophosphatase
MTEGIDVMIEIPYNSYIKYEYDEKVGKIRCDRILNTSMCYPGNYGFIPNTLSGDGDPLDILLISDYSLHPGIVINARIIGVLLTNDEKGDDEKIIMVPDDSVDTSYSEIDNYDQLPKITLSKIKHFFTHYKDNEQKKWVKVKGFKDKDYAMSIYENSKKKYNE